MPSTFQVFVGGSPAGDDFYDARLAIEVEENVDLPGAIKLSLPVTARDGDLPAVNDPRLGPFANLAVVAAVDGKPPECIFDGYLLTARLHVETGPTNARLDVWGQDASWLMNLEERAREWSDVTDAAVANAIFGEYGITPAAGNLDDDSPSHTEDGQTLMQRATDIQFLNDLARRNGKLCRVVCAGTPGQRTGWFARPKVDGDPVVTLTINQAETWTVAALDVSWDVTRPSAVKTRQKLFTDRDPDGAGVETADSGLPPLDERGLSTFAGRTTHVLLTAPVTDAGELDLRARSLLTEAGWFVRCEGEVDVSRLGAVLRAGTIVQVNGMGALHSGKYFVWSARHQLNRETHRTKFVLLRNAVGSPGGTNPLGGLL